MYLCRLSIKGAIGITPNKPRHIHFCSEKVAMYLLPGNISQLCEHAEMCQWTQNPFVILVFTREEQVCQCVFPPSFLL